MCITIYVWLQWLYAVGYNGSFLAWSLHLYVDIQFSNQFLLYSDSGQERSSLGLSLAIDLLLICYTRQRKSYNIMSDTVQVQMYKSQDSRQRILCASPQTARGQLSSTLLLPGSSVAGGPTLQANNPSVWLCCQPMSFGVDHLTFLKHDQSGACARQQVDSKLLIALSPWETRA